MCHKSILTRIIVLGSLLQLTACSTLGYLAHTSHGHMKLMSDRQPIARLLEDDSLDQTQAEQFKTILAVREFAIRQLHLPDNESYTTYVNLKRDYVTWVVFAAPQLSLQAESWCFWIVGCVPYRGYFDERKAKQFAEQLRKKSLDVYIAPVPAYSTLGWFSDPVLSSMLNRGEVATAEYIFHELAHQQLYIKNHTSFNEAFATTVGRLGVETWLQSENKTVQLKQYQQIQQNKQEIYEIVEQLKLQLSDIYESSLTDEKEKVHLKQSAFAEYKKMIVSKTKKWKHQQKYQQWLMDNMNNAKLNSFSTYQSLVPAFISLFERCNRNFADFYVAVQSTQALSDMQRIEFLHKAKCHSEI
ncbi:MAG: aminopeptidase [Gammaproteobacteria bacterium]|nr:aminopeptidase [Gammaproteobacteria bacterium]